MKIIAILALAIVLCAGTGTAFALKKHDIAPLFSLRDSKGSFFHLSSYVGANSREPVKGIIISFFASFCKPCRKELPILNAMTPELEKQGIKTIIIGFQEDFQKIDEILTELKIDKPIVLSDNYGKVGEKYGLRGLPLMLLINSDGTIADVITGELPKFEKALRQKIKFLK